MPLYEYYCPKCKLRFERLLKVSAADEICVPCPECETPAERAISRFAMRGEEGSFGDDDDDGGSEAPAPNYTPKSDIEKWRKAAKHGW
ncbi:MAG: zinc ribbon domain-containing protein [Chloroflexi bacterium]|nr:zinc ribbon domain-containing protein [Chloroflexota bacterium]